MNSRENENQKQEPSQKPASIFETKDNLIAIYSVLSILVKMKSELGLEAMLEYVHNYLFEIERHNPKLKFAVAKALSLMSIEKIYREATRNEQT